MNETIIGQTRSSKQDQWRQPIADQERSGLSVKQFCTKHGLAECSFYAWRKRLRKMPEPVRFALVERKGMMRQEPAGEGQLELVLVTGARLRIGAGVDSTTLRTVLEALHV
jgi:hypothetical protein